jgi:hypothetical protein
MENQMCIFVENVDTLMAHILLKRDGLLENTLFCHVGCVMKNEPQNTKMNPKTQKMMNEIDKMVLSELYIIENHIKLMIAVGEEE